MVEALETTPFRRAPAQHRRDDVAAHRADVVAQPDVLAAPRPAPTFTALVAEAHKIARRDELPISGHIVIERKRGAMHRHAVWLIGPFALVEGGWFGQALGAERFGSKPQRWLRRHERRCHEQHWTQFRWIDEASLQEGCGDPGVGLGRGPDGPFYCAMTAGNGDGRHTHLPLATLLRDGLRELAVLG
jgi:hypothetical protein